MLFSLTGRGKQGVRSVFWLQISECTVHVVQYPGPSHCNVSDVPPTILVGHQKEKEKPIDRMDHSLPLDLVSLNSALHLLSYLVRVVCSETC